MNLLKFARITKRQRTAAPTGRSQGYVPEDPRRRLERFGDGIAMGLRPRGPARAPRRGANSPRRVRLIGLDLRCELGIPQQRCLMRRHHDSGRENQGAVGLLID